MERRLADWGENDFYIVKNDVGTEGGRSYKRGSEWRWEAHCKPIVIFKKYARSCASSDKRTRGHPSYISALGGWHSDRVAMPPNTSECFDKRPGYTRKRMVFDASKTIVPSDMYNSGCRFQSSESCTLVPLRGRVLFFAGEASEDDAMFNSSGTWYWWNEFVISRILHQVSTYIGCSRRSDLRVWKLKVSAEALFGLSRRCTYGSAQTETPTLWVRKLTASIIYQTTGTAKWSTRRSACTAMHCALYIEMRVSK